MKRHFIILKELVVGGVLIHFIWLYSQLCVNNYFPLSENSGLIHSFNVIILWGVFFCFFSFKPNSLRFATLCAINHSLIKPNYFALCSSSVAFQMFCGFRLIKRLQNPITVISGPYCFYYDFSSIYPSSLFCNDLWSHLKHLLLQSTAEISGL